MKLSNLIFKNAFLRTTCVKLKYLTLKLVPPSVRVSWPDSPLSPCSIGIKSVKMVATNFVLASICNFFIFSPFLGHLPHSPVHRLCHVVARVVQDRGRSRLQFLRVFLGRQTKLLHAGYGLKESQVTIVQTWPSTQTVGGGSTFHLSGGGGWFLELLYPI